MKKAVLFLLFSLMSIKTYASSFSCYANSEEKMPTIYADVTSSGSLKGITIYSMDGRYSKIASILQEVEGASGVFNNLQVQLFRFPSSEGEIRFALPKQRAGKSFSSYIQDSEGTYKIYCLSVN